MSFIPQQVVCDLPGCSIVRKEANHWFVLLADDTGVKIYPWSKAPIKAQRTGKHFCGVAHAIQYASYVLTPDKTDPRRESTLELKPPLKREAEQQPFDVSVN